MEGKILFRAVIEVVGKPQEHVDRSMKEYTNKLKYDKRYKVVSEEYADIKKHEEQGLWATFAELEVKADHIQDLVSFCFDYMPSLIEVIEPSELHFKDVEVSNFLNDLQAKLHQVDMIAKQVKFENDHLKNNTGGLLKNYITVLLSKGELTSSQISKLTGVSQDNLEDFLDQLIDEGKIDLKGEKYFLREREV